METNLVRTENRLKTLVRMEINAFEHKLTYLQLHHHVGQSHWDLSPEEEEGILHSSAT